MNEAKFTESDLSVYSAQISSFWVERGIDMPVDIWYPETVLVREYNGVVTHIVGLYETNSPVAWLGWPVSNPGGIPKGYKENGLRELLAFAEGIAKEKGFKIIFTTSSTPAVEESLVGNNFTVGDTNVNHYIKKLWE